MEIRNEVTSTVYTLSVKIASRGTECFAYDNIVFPFCLFTTFPLHWKA